MQTNKMKAIFVSVVLTVIFALLSTAAAYANNNINVTVEGQRVNFTGQPPVIFEGRTLVPVRGVFEQMGFEVGWDNATRRITLTNNRYTVVLTVGSNEFTKNGVRRTLDIPPQIINGTTMLPIRSVLESVGYQLDWDGRGAGTVIITALPQTTPTQQPNAPGWRTINGSWGVRLSAPSAWEYEESQDRTREIVVNIEGYNLIMLVAKSDETAFNRFMNDTHPEHLVIAHRSFLFDDGTEGWVVEREYDIHWLHENAILSFFFTPEGSYVEGTLTFDRTFFHENEETITRVARSLTVTE